MQEPQNKKLIIQKILHDVAFNSMHSLECSDERRCTFCYAYGYSEDTQHDSDCPVRLARQLLGIEVKKS